jgi:hypothetical protein
VAATGATFVRHEWVFVHGPADAVAAIMREEAVPVFACRDTDGVAHVTKLVSWLSCFDPSLQCGVGRGDQFEVLRARRADDELMSSARPSRLRPPRTACSNDHTGIIIRAWSGTR